MTQVTIYHNPKCSKSRQTLALLEEKNITPEIILYKETAISAAQLSNILLKLNLSARDLIRKSESEYDSMGLENQDLSEEQLIDSIIKAPILMQRPIVLANGQARIGRPPESVLEII